MKWEYVFETFNRPLFGAGDKKIEKWMNKLGADGWELVSISNENRAGNQMVCVLKRPVGGAD